MSKVSKICEFPPEVRKRIKERDGGCIFCRMYGYSGIPASQIMHFVGRGRLGRGVEENGALGCAKHHTELDNGTGSIPMREDFKRYLQSIYPDWNEADLVYNKWGFYGIG